MNNQTNTPGGGSPIAAAVEATVPTFAGGWYAIQRKDNDDETEISIYDAIGEFGISADQFVRDLRSVRARQINVRINTPGGEMFAATAIYNALREHPARVVTYVDGVAASAGSFIAVAGDEVRMADNSYIMIHNARGGVMGEAEDMRRYADTLEKMNDNIAAMYQRKAGKDREHWRGLMTAETWFTAEEAKAAGLADEVYTATKKPTTGRSIKASFDFTIYNKIPEPVRAMWGLNKPEPAPFAVTSSGTSTTVLHIQTNQQPAPESPTSSVEPPPAVSQEELPTMANENPQAAPAQTPAAVATSNQPQGQSTQQVVMSLNDAAIQRHTEHGKIVGRTEGRNSLMDEIRAIVGACPGRPQTAINAILAGQNASTVKLIVDAEVNAEIKSNQRAQEQELEIAKLRSEQARLMELSSYGGHPGVPMNVSVFAPGARAAAEPSAPSGLEPRAQAELEWDGDPMLRAHNGGEAGKKRWLLFREQQLAGNVRILKTA